MEHLDPEEERSTEGSMTSLLLLCDLIMEGSCGAIVKLDLYLVLL